MSTKEDSHYVRLVSTNHNALQMNLADRSRRRRRGPRNEASDIRRVPSAQVSEEVLSLGSPFLLRDDSERDASKAGTLTPRRGQPMPDAHTLRDRSHSLNDGFSRSMSTQREPSNHAYTTASQTPNRQYNPLDPDRTVRRQNGSTSLPSPSMNPQSADSPDNLHSRASMLTRIKRVTSNVANVFFSPSSTPVPRHRTVSKNFDVFHGRALSSRDRIFDSNSTTFTSSSASSTSAFVSSSSESDMSLSNYSAWEKASDRNNGTSQHDSRARTGSLPPAIAGGHIFRNYASTIHRQVDDALFTPPSSPELHYSTNRMPSSLQSLSSESEFPYLELSHFRSNSGFDDRYADSRVFEANYEEDGHRSDVFLVAQESHSIAQTNLESQLDTNYDFDPDQTIQLPRSETLADLGNVLDEYRYRDYEMQDGDHTPSYEYGEDLLLMPMGPEFDKNDSGDGDGLVEDGDEMLFDPNGSVPDLWRASSEENISVIMRSGLRTGAARRDRNGAGISGTSTPSENSVLKRRRQSGVGDGGAVTFGNGTEYDMKLADDDAERYLAPAFQGNSSSYHSNSALGADGRDDDAMTVSWAAPAVELFHDHEEYDDMPLLQPDAFYREFNSAENKEELVAARSREDKGKGVDLSYVGFLPRFFC